MKRVMCGLTELSKPEVMSGISWSVAWMLALPAWSILQDPWKLTTPDYVLAIADKPSTPDSTQAADGPKAQQPSS